MLAKLVLSGVLVCYYPVAPPSHVMAVLSGTRVVRVLCMVMATPDVRLLVCASRLRSSVLGYSLRPRVVLILNASCF